MVGIKNWLNHRPSGLNCFLTSEECAVAGHGIAQQPLIGRFFTRLLFDQIEFSLVAEELLSCTLDASGQRDGGTGGKPESQVIRTAVRGR